MGFWSFFTLLCLVGFYVNWYGTTKALRINSNIEKGPKLPSLPNYYGRHALLSFILVSTTILLVWIFLKPFILDLLLENKISVDLTSSFDGDPSMLIDTIKATDPNNFFPGTNPLIIEFAKYYKYIKETSDSYV